MYTLGICNAETSSACLFRDGILISAVSEERFSRIKMDESFPKKSIKYILSENQLNINQLDNVAYSWAKGFDQSLLANYTKRSAELFKKDKKSFEIFQERINIEIERDSIKKKEFWDWSKRNLNQSLYNRIFCCYHHEAHAYSASLLSHFNEGIVLVADGRGDFESTTIWKFNRSSKKPLQKLYSNTSSDSLGFFYGRITGLLGFKPCRHEGKITGLAARGNPNNALYLMKEMIDFHDGEIKANLSKYYIPFYTNYSSELIEKVSSHSKEDIAAAAQLHLENLLVKLINHTYKKHRLNGMPLMLAGGVFGNVKANQILKELEIVNDAFVQPQMNDGGLCLGVAAAAQHFENISIKPLQNVYLGPNPRMNKFTNFNDLLHIEELEEPIEKIISHLKQNKVIGLVRGRMEFGPRALCHRSIIYKTSDRSANDWLNNRMQRTEFMPFAPVMTNQQAKKSFLKFEEKDITLKFMTATLEANDDFCKRCPAVAHIDKTARPQIIYQEEDPFMWNLLTKWEEVSGEYSLINTSFNAHEEPIVCSEDDAIKGLLNQTIDILIINSIQITLTKSEK